MGAQNISLTIKGKADLDTIKAKFYSQQEEDKDYNGHQEGYSGDFQTVSGVVYKDTIFDSYDEAQDYCLNKAQKWEFVVAVHYKEGDKINTLIAGWGAC